MAKTVLVRYQFVLVDDAGLDDDDIQALCKKVEAAVEALRIAPGVVAIDMEQVKGDK